MISGSGSAWLPPWLGLQQGYAADGRLRVTRRSCASQARDGPAPRRLSVLSRAPRPQSSHFSTTAWKRASFTARGATTSYPLAHSTPTGLARAARSCLSCRNRKLGRTAVPLRRLSVPRWLERDSVEQLQVLASCLDRVDEQVVAVVEAKDRDLEEATRTAQMALRPAPGWPPRTQPSDTAPQVGIGGPPAEMRWSAVLRLVEAGPPRRQALALHGHVRVEIDAPMLNRRSPTSRSDQPERS